MSRFFATGGSDSESESTSSGEDIPQKKQDAAPAYAFSDEEEDVKRVVRSAKAKRYEELSNIIRQIKNHRKIRDMSSLLSSFEELTRAYAKALPVMLKEECTTKPRFYIKCLVDIEDCVNDAWEDRKSLSKTNAKSLGTLRQKIRKYNRDFEDEINSLRADPEAMAAEEELDVGGGTVDQDSDMSDDEELNEVSEALSKTSFLKDGSSTKDETAVSSKTEKRDDEGSSDEDSIDWGSDETESETSSEDEGKYTSLVEKFMKKNTQKEEEDKKQKREKKKLEKGRAKQARRAFEDEEGDKEGWTEVRGGGVTAEKPKMFAKDQDITHALVLKKLIEIVAARGKKGTDRQEQVALLSELRSIADQKELGPAMKAKVDFAIIAALFDYNPAVSTAMKEDHWEKVLKKILELLDDLANCEDLVVGENILEENESFESPPYKIRGCVLTVCERMDDEFNKILKECDAHGPEYVKRLKDEKTVCVILEKVQKYLEGKDVGPSDLCRIYLRRVEHTYYKFDPTALAAKKAREEGATDVPVTSLETIDQLCKFIYAKDNTDRLRTRAILCNIYHHALHDNWYAARDLMLMSHLQDTIQHSDPPTQILYNRTMVQVGLCSFRHAKIKDAHDALLDIQSGGRAKELLSQGLLLQVRMERSSEQEKIEKQRQMPFHMHINLELLECVYLVSAMLMEIPYMAAHEFNARRRLISKSFHHQLKVSERQAVIGPPESMREHVVAAARSMRNGKWRACRDFIINEKMNAKVWDLFYQADKVREMLTQKIQEESLRTYLFTYSHVYDSMSLVTLSEMFELDRATVHSIISKMIINEELMASLDEPTHSLVMHKTEPSRLQSLALQVADKVGLLVEYNERILEAKSGVFTQRTQQPFRQQYGGPQGRNQESGRGGWNRRNQGDRGDGRDGGNKRQGGGDGDRRRGGGGGGGGRDRDTFRRDRD